MKLSKEDVEVLENGKITTTGHILVSVLDIMTTDKQYSLGNTMTVKEACDLGWNKIEIIDADIISCWKNFYAGIECDYTLGVGWENYAKTREDFLANRITLADYYDTDDNGCPIVNASFA